MRLVLPDVSLSLETDRGVFAADAVDAGTKLLLMEAAEVPSGPVDLLDLGCGYGPIAVTLARRSPAATVWAVDVNSRARELALENAAAADVGDRVRVCAPEDVPSDVRFGGIWSNPPIKVGNDVLHGMLLEWLPRLAEGALAWLVVHKHLGSDSLARWLGEQGFEVERVRSRSGYRILRVGAW